jgi:hypothetical protein
MRIAQIHKTKSTSWLIASCFCVFFLALSHPYAQSVVSSLGITDDMWPVTLDAEEIFASLRPVDSISSIYVDLINESSQAIGRLDADVIDLASK